MSQSEEVAFTWFPLTIDVFIFFLPSKPFYSIHDPYILSCFELIMEFKIDCTDAIQLHQEFDFNVVVELVCHVTPRP